MIVPQHGISRIWQNTFRISTRASEATKAENLIAVNLPDLLQRIKFLNLDAFKQIVGTEGQLGTRTASAILPINICTIQLRRAKDVIMRIRGTDMVIGGDIPRYRVWSRSSWKWGCTRRSDMRRFTERL